MALPIHLVLFSAALSCSIAFSAHAQSRETLPADNVLPMEDWLKLREATYGTKPILLHLRTGYERAVVLPEPVETKDGQTVLTGCRIVIEDNIIGFYPGSSFEQTSVVFIGLESGDEYKLLVRSSPTGKRQPLRILR